MISSVVKVALIAGVAGAVVLSTGATAIAATREDPGVMVVSVTADDDDPDKATTPKKGSKAAKDKKKVRYESDFISRSYSMYSSISGSGRSQARVVAAAPPRGQFDFTRDLLAEGRP